MLNSDKVLQQIRNLARVYGPLQTALDNNYLSIDSTGRITSSGGPLPHSIGMLCIKAVMTDMLSIAGFGIVSFKHEGNFRFTGTRASFGDDSEETISMSYVGDNDGNAHLTTWLCMANEILRTHLGVVVE